MASALDELYAEHGRRVFLLALRMTGDRELAADVTQDTFALVAARLDGFRGDCAVGTWIFAIARNRCLSAMDRARRGSFRAMQDLVDAAAAETPPVLEEMERRWCVGQVREGCLLGLLRCLPFHQRMAFILSVLFGMPARDVSRILGKSVNSARILASRGRAALKEFLCANCTHCGTGNPCRCESFVGFSLKRGWIEAYSPSFGVEEVAAEICGIKDEVRMYQLLAAEQEASPRLEALWARLRDRGPLVTGQKKVK
jgi:RNA polymerase sigma-70 factor, ECF subfamily